MNGVVTALSGALCSDVTIEDDKDNLRFNAGRLIGALTLALTAGAGAYFVTGAVKPKKADNDSSTSQSA